jgi:SNF2-related domain
MTSDAFENFKEILAARLCIDLLIVDEGHKAKNVDTVLRKGIKNFHAKKQKIILTGTPV